MSRYAERFYREPEPSIGEPDTVLCELCSNPTRMTSTKRCTRCWELETRIKADPELAKQIIARLGNEQ